MSKLHMERARKIKKSNIISAIVALGIIVALCVAVYADTMDEGAQITEEVVEEVEDLYLTELEGEDEPVESVVMNPSKGEYVAEVVVNAKNPEDDEVVVQLSGGLSINKALTYRYNKHVNEYETKIEYDEKNDQIIVKWGDSQDVEEEEDAKSAILIVTRNGEEGIESADSELGSIQVINTKEEEGITKIEKSTPVAFYYAYPGYPPIIMPIARPYPVPPENIVVDADVPSTNVWSEAELPEDILESNVDVTNMFFISKNEKSLFTEFNEAAINTEYRNIIDLTSDDYTKTGSAWYEYRHNIENDLHVESKIYLGDKPASEGGGYGMLFAIHDNIDAFGFGKDLVGVSGPGMGAGSEGEGSPKMYNGIVIEFDTIMNTMSHGKYENGRYSLKKDYGTDWDIWYLKGIDNDTHLMHTGIQHTWNRLPNSIKRSYGLTDFFGSMAQGADTIEVPPSRFPKEPWHRYLNTFTTEDMTPYGRKMQKEDIFGQWLDLVIDWTVNSDGTHQLSYVLYYPDGIEKLAETSINIEEEYGSTGDLFYDGENVIWGFTATTNAKDLGFPDKDMNTNRQAVAIKDISTKSNSYAEKYVRNATKQEEFGGSTIAEIGDELEYKIVVGVSEDTPIPLVTRNISDLILHDQELIESSITVEKRGTTFSVADGSITEGVESDNGVLHYHDITRETRYGADFAINEMVSNPPEESLVPKYIYDENTKELLLYGLGAVGIYAEFENEDKDWIPDMFVVAEEMEITFKTKVTTKGNDGIIANQAQVYSEEFEDLLFTNSHLSKEEKEKRGVGEGGETIVRIPTNLNVTKEVSHKEQSIGNRLAYTIEISNEKDKPTWKGSFEDVLSDDLTNIVIDSIDTSDYTGPTITSKIEGNTVLLEGIELPEEESLVVTISAEIKLADGHELSDNYIIENTAKMIDENQVEIESNKVETKVSYLVDFIIEKKIKGKQGFSKTKEQFVFRIEYESEDSPPETNTLYGVVTILPGKSEGQIEFKNMRPGTYYITELNNNWRYKLDTSVPDNDQTQKLELIAPTISGTVSFTNTLDRTRWASGKNNVTNIMELLE